MVHTITAVLIPAFCPRFYNKLWLKFRWLIGWLTDWLRVPACTFLWCRLFSPGVGLQFVRESKDETGLSVPALTYWPHSKGFTYRALRTQNCTFRRPPMKKAGKSCSVWLSSPTLGGAHVLLCARHQAALPHLMLGRHLYEANTQLTPHCSGFGVPWQLVHHMAKNQTTEANLRDLPRLRFTARLQRKLETIRV